MNIIEGKLEVQGRDYKVGIIAGRFNDFITNPLVSGAVDGLKRFGIKEEAIDLYKVPGAFEIPMVAKKLAKSKKYDGIICLGAVIRGATPHFDVVCAEVSKGVAKVSMDFEIPVIFGVLTTNTIEQGIERAGTKAGNKGFDAAISCVEMMDLLRNLP